MTRSIKLAVMGIIPLAICITSLDAAPNTNGLLNSLYQGNTGEGSTIMLSETWAWALMGLVLLMVLIIAILLRVRITLNEFSEKNKLKNNPETYTENATWWDIFVKAEKDRPLDAPIQGHSYDGIVELDNNPPSWFNWLFFLPIAWGVFYVMYYHVLELAPLQDGEYAAEMKIAEASMPEVKIDYTTMEPLTATDDLARGEVIFKSNCAACHLENGAGSVGPNLTDKFWLHGGDFSSIYKTVYEGVDGKGMAAWGDILMSDDIHKVSSYIETLRNTDVKGKAPEGDEYK